MKSIKYIFAFLFFIILLNSCREPISIFVIHDKEGNEVRSARAGESLIFTNLSIYNKTNKWDFDDGSNSDEESPLHSFEEGDSYSIKLQSDNLSGDDNTYKKIKIYSLNGEWEGEFSMGNYPYPFVLLDLEQEYEEIADGDFAFVGYAKDEVINQTRIDEGSLIEGDIEIIIKLKYPDEEPIELVFSGTVDQDCENMEGTVSIDGSEYGDWSAEKTNDKSVIVNNNTRQNYELQFLTEYKKLK